MKFSIVTPSFNQLDYLRNCIYSVSDQGVEIEHIVQDGGSTDFSLWCGQLDKQRLNHTVFLCEKDSGMYDAINRGWSKAKGDILSWLNCDEQYLPGALKKVERYFVENPDVDIVFGDVVLVDNHGKPLAYRKMMVPDLQHTRYCFLATLSAGMFVRRKVVQDNNHYLDTRWRAIADMVWVESLIRQGVKMGVINEPLAVFTLTGDNLGQSTTCHNEGQNWQREIGATSKLGLRVQQVLHRLRKLMYGGYKRRSISIDIYPPNGTHDSRVTYTAKVGGRWI